MEAEATDVQAEKGESDEVSHQKGQPTIAKSAHAIIQKEKERRTF